MDGEAGAPRQQMADELPRHAPLRASVHNATEHYADIKALAHSGGGHQAIDLLRSTGESASPNVAFATDWGHDNAGYWLRKTEAEGQAFLYNNAQPAWPATFCAAEFQISRQFGLRSMEDYLSRL